MKNRVIVLLWLVTTYAAAQGKFASPEWKARIGQTFSTEGEIPGLKGYQLREGTMITEANDPEPMSVSWYMKLNTILVLFEQIGPRQTIAILDVLEIKNTTGSQEIKTAVCKDGQSENAGIVALVQTSDAKRVKAIKAWLFNRDKIRIEAWPAQNVTCLGAVGED